MAASTSDFLAIAAAAAVVTACGGRLDATDYRDQARPDASLVPSQADASDDGPVDSVDAGSNGRSGGQPSGGDTRTIEGPSDARADGRPAGTTQAVWTADGGAALCSAPGCPSNWWTIGHDAAHTGYNPTETGTPPMTGQWSTTFGGTLTPASAEDGRAFVSYGGTAGAGSMLAAVAIADGSSLWSHDFGHPFSVGQSTVVAGTVYVQTNKGVSDNPSSELWAFDAATGALRWSAPFASQWENFWAPTLGGSGVFVNGGTYGGMYGFRTRDGAQLFFDDALPQCDSWSPAYYKGVLYTYIQGSLIAHDPASGDLLWNNEIRGTFEPYSMNATAAFDGQAAYFISPPQLVSVDLVSQDVRWSTSADFKGSPAVANGVIYAVSGGDLVASDEATGTSSFTFAGDGALTYPPVVANGFVYVSSNSNVYAVSLATHNGVWSASVGGWLSIASGSLLVAGNGVLHGFVLSLSGLGGEDGGIDGSMP